MTFFWQNPSASLGGPFVGARHPPDERRAGFSIGIYDESIIEENAHEQFYDRPKMRQEALAAGLMDAKGDEITKKGWDLLNKDSIKLERNSLRWMKKKFKSATDEGHDAHGDLAGTVWYDPADPEQVRLIDLGVEERIDMVDSSYGDLAHSVWDGVSDFGAAVLGGGINFQKIEDED